MIRKELKSGGILALGAVALVVAVMLAGSVCGNGNAVNALGNGALAATAKVPFFRVQAASATNNDTGRTTLTKYQNVLKGRGYSDIEIKPNADKSKLCLLVGKFAPNDMMGAEALKNKLIEEPYEGKFPFKDATVVHGMD